MTGSEAQNDQVVPKESGSRRVNVGNEQSRDVKFLSECVGSIPDERAREPQSSILKDGCDLDARDVDFW